MKILNLLRVIKEGLQEVPPTTLKKSTEEAKVKQNELFGLEKHGRGDDQLLRQFEKKAELESKAGYVVHVNRTKTGFELSDWFDDKETVSSFENGKKLGETVSKITEQDPHPSDLVGILDKIAKAPRSKQDIVLAKIDKMLRKKLKLDFDFVRIPSRESTKQFRASMSSGAPLHSDPIGGLDLSFHNSLGSSRGPNLYDRQQGLVRRDKAIKVLQGIGVDAKPVSSVTLNIPKKEVVKLLQHIGVQSSLPENKALKPLKEGVSNKLSQLEVGDQFLVQDDLYIKRSGPYPGMLFKKGRLDKIPFTVLKKNPSTLVLGFDKKYVVDSLTKAKGLYDQTTNVIPSSLVAKFQSKIWACVVDFTPKTVKTKKGPITVGVDSKVRVTKGKIA